LTVHAEMMGDERRGWKVLCRARHVRREAERDRRRLRARLVDDEHRRSRERLRRRELDALGRASWEAGHVARDLFGEPGLVGAGNPDVHSISAEYTRSMRGHVIERDRLEAGLGAFGRMTIRVALVEHRLERFFAERFVARAAKIVGELARLSFLQSPEGLVVEPRREENVAKQRVELGHAVLGDLHLEDRFVAIDADADARGDWIEPLGELGVREIFRAALGHHRREQLREALLAGGIVGRAGAERDAEGDDARGRIALFDQRRLRRLHAHGGVGGRRARDVRRGGIEVARGQKERRAENTNRNTNGHLPAAFSVIAVRRVGSKFVFATRATSSFVTWESSAT
jgi:hypothetical protein